MKHFSPLWSLLPGAGLIKGSAADAVAASPDSGMRKPI